MPKFANGEFALLEGSSPRSKHKELLAYEGTVVQVLLFLGYCPDGESLHGDWYRVSGEDDRQFFSREVVLKKLPDEYSPGDMRIIEEIMNKRAVSA